MCRLHADFCVDTSWKAEVLQAVDRLRRRVRDVDQELVHAHFEAFTTRLVDVRALDHRERALASRQWYRTGD